MGAALTAGGWRVILRRQSRAGKILSVRSTTSDLCRDGGAKCVKKCQTKEWKQVLSHAGRFVHKCAGWPVTRLLFSCSDSAWNGAEDGSIKIWAHGWTSDSPLMLTCRAGAHPPPPTDLLPHPGAQHCSPRLHFSPTHTGAGIDPPLSRLLSSSSKRLIKMPDASQMR